MMAAKDNNIEVIEALLCWHADINARDDSTATVLMYAAAFNTLEVVEYLVLKGADVTLTDQYGTYASGYALQYSQSPRHNGHEIESYLIQETVKKTLKG